MPIYTCSSKIACNFYDAQTAEVYTSDVLTVASITITAMKYDNDNEGLWIINKNVSGRFTFENSQWYINLKGAESTSIYPFGIILIETTEINEFQTPCEIPIEFTLSNATGAVLVSSSALKSSGNVFYSRV
jgi:hypothetical protein